MPDALIKRQLEDEIQRYLERREIIGIRGARQTGKTTLMKTIEKNTQEDSAFINLDLMEYRRALEEAPMDLVKRFKRPGKRLVLLLDEVQRVREAGEKLKIIYDEFPDVKMLISGSSSLELKTNVLPPLVGRLLLFQLHTLGFGEFLAARDERLAALYREKHESLKGFLEGDGEIAPPSFQEEFLDHWKDYVVFGGYPEVVKAKDRQERIVVLKNIFNLYLEKDITAFFKIEEASIFQDLVRLLAFNISGLLSTSSLASDLNASYRKVEGYLNILEHTYIVHLLKPFHRNLSTELKKSPKPYFLDLGLRNCALENFTPFDSRTDRGPIAENFILRELVSSFPGWRLNYWRTAGKAEVDFVLRMDEKVVPVEVKLSGERLGKSFYSFLNAYEPEKAVIANFNKFGKQVVGKTAIYWVPIFYF